MAITPPTNYTLADATAWPTTITNEVNSLGWKGYSQITTTSSAYATLTDISGLSVTWTASSLRVYKVTVQYMVLSTVSGDHANIWLRDGGGNKLGVHTREIPLNSLAEGGSLVARLTGLSGSQTVKVSVERASGTGNISIVANAIYPQFILVEDIGAA